MAKQRTPKQLANDKKLGEQARARAAAKAQSEQIHAAPPVIENDQNTDVLIRQIKELQQNQELLKAALLSQPNQQTAQVTNQGVVGTTDKYVVDPAYYPDPSERLKAEPKLKRFAFDENYELDFKTTSSSYQTIDGRRMKEPKFTLELHRKVFDEDTGVDTGGRYVVCRAVFHEDPEAAIVVARENGLEVDESNQKNFLDEMRYIRMRDWLLEAFYPPKSTNRREKKEMVLNGRLVEYFEVNSENSSNIPFDQLKSKIKG